MKKAARVRFLRAPFSYKAFAPTRRFIRLKSQAVVFRCVGVYFFIRLKVRLFAEFFKIVVGEKFGVIFQPIGFGDFAQHSAGRACGKAVFRDIPRYNASRADYAAVSEILPASIFSFSVIKSAPFAYKI